MYELHQVGDNSFYIESPAQIGLYRIDDVLYLADCLSCRETLDKYQIVPVLSCARPNAARQ